MSGAGKQLGGMPTAGWVLAAVFAVAMHVGAAALSLVTWPEEDTSFDAAGVIPVELAPLATSTALDNPEAAPGPAAQEAPNTPEASRKTEAKPDDTVPLERSPAPDPEVALREAKPREDKPEEKPEEKVSENNPTDPSVGDPITRAPAKIEAPIAETTAASAVGTGRDALLAQATWQKSLLSHLNTHKRYPAEARSRAQQGTAKVQFTIDRTGKVVDATILASAGAGALDAEALAVLKRSSPLPAPPDSMAGEVITLILPIQFHIK